jgi:hypothetical protein
VPLSWLLPPSKFYDRRRASRDPRADMHSLVDHA